MFNFFTTLSGGKAGGDTLMGKMHENLKEFLRVVIVEREKFDTVEKAAAELKMGKQGFNNRLKRTRESYPDIFVTVKGYPRKPVQKPSQDEAAALLVGLSN